MKGSRATLATCRHLLEFEFFKGYYQCLSIILL